MWVKTKYISDLHWKDMGQDSVDIWLLTLNRCGSRLSRYLTYIWITGHAKTTALWSSAPSFPMKTSKHTQHYHWWVYTYILVATETLPLIADFSYFPKIYFMPEIMSIYTSIQTAKWSSNFNWQVSFLCWLYVCSSCTVTRWDLKPAGCRWSWENHKDAVGKQQDTSN